MSDRATGEPLTLESAAAVIHELKGFPVALWSLENHERYNAAFEVFWSHKPPYQPFHELMLGAPVTPEMIWTMLYVKR